MSKQIQYFSPTNLANYRERCKRKRIFIQRIYANSFKYCKYWKELVISKSSYTSSTAKQRCSQ